MIPTTQSDAAFRVGHLRGTIGAAFVLIALLSTAHARAPLGIDIPAVRSGDYKYEGSTPSPVQIVVEDARKHRDPFVWGRKIYDLTFAQGGKDPLAFLGGSLAAELSKHGIPASVKPSTGAKVMTLRVEQFDVEVRWSGSYAPFQTLTRFHMVATYEGKSHSVSDFVMHVKRRERRDDKDAWVYLFNEPLHMIVRQASAKLNQGFWKLSVSDAVTDKLIAAVPDSRHLDTMVRITDVACTSNQRASTFLSTLIAHADQPTRRSAIWGLGVVGSGSAIPSLEKAGVQTDIVDTYLAVKSLSDIGTPEARSAIKKVDAAQRPGMNEVEVATLNSVLGLYR